MLQRSNGPPAMSAVRTPAKHFTALAIGAPEPYRQLPVRLERMVHFVPPHNEKIRASSFLRGIPKLIEAFTTHLEPKVYEKARAAFTTFGRVAYSLRNSAEPLR